MSFLPANLKLGRVDGTSLGNGLLSDFRITLGIVGGLMPRSGVIFGSAFIFFHRSVISSERTVSKPRRNATMR